MSLSNLQTKLGCLDYPLYWLIQKIHPIVELSVFWIQLSNLNYVTIWPIMDIRLTKIKRALHNQRHESIKRLKEQSIITRCFRRSLYPSSAKHLSNECKIQVKPLAYQILRQHNLETIFHQLAKKASEEGIPQWFDVDDTSLALLWHFFNLLKKVIRYANLYWL